MSRNLSIDDLTDALVARKVIQRTGPPPDAAEDRPWYISTVLGAAGWFAGLFTLVFVAILVEPETAAGFGFAGVMTCLMICAREAAPLRLSGSAMAVVTTAGWIGMGLGSYQAGYFYDLSASYVLSYANGAIAGILNLAVVAALFWYRRAYAVRPAPLANA